jgi:hypothetical protein
MEAKTFDSCAVCGKPCSLENCKTDELGRAVHDACYVMAMLSKQNLPPTYPSAEG